MKKIVFCALTAATMMAFTACSGNSKSKDGSLPGKFSVSDTTQIQFSQGNLQYQPSTQTWRFAENQFDTIGKLNSNIADDYEGWIDLFGWGTGATPTNSSSNNQHYPDFTDWSNNTIINSGENNQWRTLTVQEWKYLFFKREDAGSLHGVGQVNGHDGIIILPDEWIQPEGTMFYLGYSKRGIASQVNCYTLEEWQKMETAGAVFLPQAGDRRGKKLESEYAHYWSSSVYNYAQAYYVFFSPLYVQADCYGGRSYGRSVRLVQNAK